MNMIFKKSFLLLVFLTTVTIHCYKKKDRETVLPPDLTPLVNQIKDSLDTEFNFSAEPFDDFVSNRQLPAIVLSATASGSKWDSVDSITNRVQSILQEHGWEQKFDYSADGPDGTAFGFIKDNHLCQVRLTWEPTDGVEIADQDEITFLTPNQLHYELNLYFVTL